MPERGAVPAVLVDGPCAGQVIYTAPEVTVWYVRTPEPIDWSLSLDSAYQLISEPTVYRFQWRTAVLEVRNSREPAWLRLRFGWSEPGEPDDQTIRRYGRAALVEHPELMPPGAILWEADPADDKPIRVLEQGNGPVPGCRDEFQIEPDSRLMRGSCPCGWRTELVESRRLEELQALTSAHGQAGMEAFRALAGRGVVGFAEYAALEDILERANRRADERIAGWRERMAQVAHGDDEPMLDWGEPLTAADRNTPRPDAMICAHVCGPDPDHDCSAAATTTLEYKNLAGGVTRLPLCGPCHLAETATLEATCE